ncbi:nickel ABC transporter, permease subunit NikB [Streptomyces albus]|uniref:Nickel ABC transporter, permease subunit NikB n=1 Tax=Streptomyces albus (strain ATCC 21838 / DSM 41398 / FERM P-419 / JCM 4703 / NBRC 107858) TaxID=1081613 RepID=A0A0B5EUZ0_STRA4|nr:nickel ABC transporter, permease subunit NikB [Streptomyces albus]AOU76826.1 nickel ABC transporter, permease subunit NikB [Streptomyces albus]AYN32603.1 ABC transporter permease [Streptomyces albus]
MTSFVLRRLGGLVLTLFVISVLVYAVFYLAPGNVAQLSCGPRCSPEQVRQVASQLHLDDPLYVRYWHFLTGLFAGQDYSTGTAVLHCDAPCLGLSYQSDQEVTQLLLDKLPASVSLAAGAVVLWLILGVGTGILSAWRRGGLTERVLTTLTLAGTAVPVFVVGLVLMVLVCGQWELLPFPQYVPFGEDPEQWAWNLLLPWVTLALAEAATFARMTRSSMLETLAEDHIRTFRAYGVPERTIVGRHALRGALAPLIALNANHIGALVGGSVLTESLFGIPGIGRELVHAVQVVDLPIVVGVMLAVGFAVVFANAVADLLYAVADRRVVLS